MLIEEQRTVFESDNYRVSRAINASAPDEGGYYVMKRVPAGSKSYLYMFFLPDTKHTDVDLPAQLVREMLEKIGRSVELR